MTKKEEPEIILVLVENTFMIDTPDKFQLHL